MRQDLLNPIKDKTRFDAAVKLVRKIYRAIDAGRDYTELLAGLNQLAVKQIAPTQIEDFAELVEPKTAAYELITDPAVVPRDLTDSEMLELVEKVCGGDADGIHLAYWTWCLEANTGDERISILIQSPELYFSDGRGPRPLTAREILDTALAAGVKKRP